MADHSVAVNRIAVIYSFKLYKVMHRLTYFDDFVWSPSPTDNAVFV